NASLSDWWGGLSFGSRRLTDQTLLLALGYGAAFDWLRTRAPALAIATATAGITWTVLLLAQFYYIIRTDIGPSWHDFLLGQLQAISDVPRLFVQGSAVRELARGNPIGGLLLVAAMALLMLLGFVLSRRLSPAI